MTIAEVVPLHASTETAATRKKYVRLTKDARARLMEELEAMADPGTPDYRKLADRYQVSLRTVERIVQETRNAEACRSVTTNRVLKHALPDDVLGVVAACRTRRGAWEVLREREIYLGDYTSFTRQLNRQFGANVVSGACKGIAGMVHSLAQKTDRRPFMNAYTIDLFSLRAPVSVGRRVVTPMGMLVREDHTNTIVNAHVFDTDAVDADMVASVVGQAIRGRTYTLSDPAGNECDVFVGGLPDSVFCDNDSRFLQRQLDGKFAGLGVRVLNINSYSSHENGAHERMHGTVRTQLLDMLPGSSNGPRDRRGELMDTRPPVELSVARQLLGAWVHKWNMNPPEGTSKTTPMQAWLGADQSVIRRANPEEIARLAYEHPETCSRYAYGVRLLNEHYLCPELTNTPSKRFVVRRWFGDDDHVELYSANGENYIGTATRNGAHTAAEAQELKRNAAEQESAVNAAVAAGQALADEILAEQAAGAPTTGTTAPAWEPPADPDDASADEPVTESAQPQEPEHREQSVGPLPCEENLLANLAMPTGTRAAAGAERAPATERPAAGSVTAAPNDGGSSPDPGDTNASESGEGRRSDTEGNS